MYFLNLEKRNFDSKLIPSLKLGDNELWSNDEILTALSEHFIRVFTSPDGSLQIETLKYLDNTICPKLSELLEQRWKKTPTLLRT